MEIKIGDKVRFLNDVGGGVVTKIVDRMSVEVMNESGFDVPVNITELIVIEEAATYVESSVSDNSSSNTPSVSVEEGLIIDTKDIFYPEVSIDDSLGDDINIFFAFVPQGRAGNSDLDVYLINDSNYNVLYSIINIEEAGKIFSNSVGVIEANTKEQIETFGLNSVNNIPEYVFHLTFYRKGEFRVKEPVVKSIKVNPVRFYKEKAYVENDFFNEDTLMFTVIADSALMNELANITDKELKQVIKQKESKEEKREYLSSKKQDKVILEVDLHIHELLDDFRGLSNSEILEVQMEHFKSKLEEAKKEKIKKVVFIHGVGNGTLKLEIRRELDKKSKILNYQDASFKEYGYGATMVQIK